MFTFQLLYLAWLKLETDEIKDEKGGTYSSSFFYFYFLLFHMWLALLCLGLVIWCRWLVTDALFSCFVNSRIGEAGG